MKAEFNDILNVKSKQDRLRARRFSLYFGEG